MMDKDKEQLQTFGRRLTEIRKELKMSQEKLALSSGIDRSYISGIERGHRNVALLNIFKLAAALNIDVVELFS
jgi:transcriptional regulator with XRE-family HTH domain